MIQMSNFISLYTIKYSIGNTSIIVNNINKHNLSKSFFLFINVFIYR